MYISDDIIDKLINEDVPYFDLTTWVLDIGNQQGQIQFFSREAAVLCGTEEVERIFDKLKIQTTFKLPSGTLIEPNQVFLSGKGSVESLHIAWKVSQNLLDSCSGIATKKKRINDAIKKINPNIALVSTRKNFPGTKQLCVKAVLCGGGFPHRLGLSETVLVFKQHLNFCGGLDGFMDQIPQIKHKISEKKLIVEAESMEDGIRLAKAGVDGIQFDKLSLDILSKGSQQIREINHQIVLLAAGGIDENNAQDYALAGMDVLVLTSLFHAKPIDMGVKLSKF
jgi:molybdenum transport protein